MPEEKKKSFFKRLTDKGLWKKIGKTALTGGAFVAEGMGIDAFEGLKGLGVFKDPEAEARAQAMLIEFEKDMAQVEVQYVQAVNETMREEAKSEHWAQWLWRPVVGFTFSGVIINNYVILPYFPSAVPIAIPSELWYAILVILGAAAGLRGAEKWQRVKNEG